MSSGKILTMKIYIVGSGGVGGYFGGILAKAGNDVTFVARGENYKAIKNNGLLVKSVKGDFAIKPAKVIDKISEIKNPDVVFFTVKTYSTSDTAKELSYVVNENTVIITFQNGVENDIQIKKYIHNAKVYPGVAYLISTKIKPGVIEQIGGLRRLTFGDRKNPKNVKLQEIVGIMKKSGIDAILSDDITRDLWKKFMFIVAFSGMTAVCRSPIGKILADPITESLYKRCVQEAIQVAKAFDVSVPNDVFITIMKTTTDTNPASKSSLLVDVENGRKNEIETLNGTLVRFARERNIDVPMNELIYAAIKLL